MRLVRFVSSLGDGKKEVESLVKETEAHVIVRASFIRIRLLLLLLFLCNTKIR
jgi:hypothetical protein